MSPPCLVFVNIRDYANVIICASESTLNLSKELRLGFHLDEFIFGTKNDRFHKSYDKFKALFLFTI